MFAEPNYYGQSAGMPDDYYMTARGSWGQDYDDQWNMKIIDMPKAWGITQGSKSVIVGVVDTGIDHTHKDLKDAVAAGWHGLLGKYQQGFAGDCTSYHGSHVTGIIGARDNDDNYGMFGVAPGITLMSFSPNACPKIPPDKLLEPRLKDKVSDSSGVSNWIAEKIGVITYAGLFLKAQSSGVDVINFSSGIPFDSYVLNQAVTSVVNDGVVFVNSAGNESSLLTSQSPANNPLVIVVGAVDQNDEFATSYSNYGLSMTVSAPGSNILSVGSSQVNIPAFVNKNVGGEHLRLSGTSMAAPHVAGLAALVKSIHPDWSPNQIKCAIILGAEDKGTPGFDMYYGYGRINAYNTLMLQEVDANCTPQAIITSPVTNGGVNKKEPVTITGIATAPELNYYLLEYLAEGSDPKNGWKVIKQSSDKVSNDTLATWDASQLPEGNYQIRLTVESITKQQAMHEISVYLNSQCEIKQKTTSFFSKVAYAEEDPCGEEDGEDNDVIADDIVCREVGTDIIIIAYNYSQRIVATGDPLFIAKDTIRDFPEIVTITKDGKVYTDVKDKNVPPDMQHCDWIVTQLAPDDKFEEAMWMWKKDGEDYARATEETYFANGRDVQCLEQKMPSVFDTPGNICNIGEFSATPVDTVTPSVIGEVCKNSAGEITSAHDPSINRSYRFGRMERYKNSRETEIVEVRVIYKLDLRKMYMKWGSSTWEESAISDPAMIPFIDTGELPKCTNEEPPDGLFDIR